MASTGVGKATFAYWDQFTLDRIQYRMFIVDSGEPTYGWTAGGNP